MKSQLISTVLLLTVLSCQQKNIEPDYSIEGTYEAKTYNFSHPPTASYPINGQHVTLRIKYVSSDTVQVDIQPSQVGMPLPAGIYSPTQTLSYPRAAVTSRIAGGVKSYYVYLVPPNVPGVLDNAISLYRNRENNGIVSADYFFTPAQYPNSTSIQFEKQQ